MSSFQKSAFAGISVLALSACGGGGGGGTAAPVLAPNAISSETGQTPVASRADVSRHRDGRIVLSMTDGPMQGMTILCADQTLGACTVVGGAPGTDPTGQLLTRMSGDYAFVGNFEVQRRDGATSQTTNQMVYAALPEQSTATAALPNGVVDYSGQFQGGFGLANGESGRIDGDTTLLANFDTGRISGNMQAYTQAGTAISANFNNLTLDATTRQFTATDDTTIRLQNQQAWGDINGGFFGPNAEEAAGVFNFGNGAGGISGLFLTCASGHSACTAP